MDIENFVKNVKCYCRKMDVKPTVACRESGAGERMLENAKRGSIPSVEKVQLLAQYLCVTTSELLGEQLPDTFDTELTPEEHRVLEAYRRADQRARDVVQIALAPFEGKKEKTASVG